MQNLTSGANYARMPFVPGMIPPRSDSRQQSKKSAAAFEIHRGWWWAKSDKSSFALDANISQGVLNN
jgi:hypothetical protein